jgi:imidazolonepropionase-like amidohydrolase
MSRFGLQRRNAASPARFAASAFALGLALGNLASVAAAQNVVAIVGGTLIDGTGRAPVPNAALVIENGVVRAAGPASAVMVPAGARVIRAEGKFVLPGLIDTHMHIGGSGGGSADKREFTPQAAANNFKSYLIFGVTTVFDIAGHPFIEGQKSALESGQLLGPRLFGVKYGITAPGSHPIGLLQEYRLTELLGPVYPQVDSVEAARAAIAKAVADKTDGVKIFHSRAEFPGTSRIDADKEKLKKEVLKTLVDDAHAARMRVFAHIAFPSEAREVVEAGVDALAHSISLSETGADEVFALMAQRGTYYIPTLATLEAIYALQHNPFALEELRGKVWDVILDSITMQNSVARARMKMPALVSHARRSLEISMANLKRAHKAGVKIAMGTDAGNAGTLHGASVPREMELMVDSGMSPMEVIVAATKGAAEAIGQGQRLGTLEPGKLADVIVVGGDVLRDIGAIRQVELVVKGGRVIDPHSIKFE